MDNVLTFFRAPIIALSPDQCCATRVANTGCVQWKNPGASWMESTQSLTLKAIGSVVTLLTRLLPHYRTLAGLSRFGHQYLHIFK